MGLVTHPREGRESLVSAWKSKVPLVPLLLPPEDCGYTHYSILQCCPSELRTSEKRPAPTFTTVACRQVHKPNNQPSYNRTYPVILRHQSSNRSIWGLAIIDDKSSATLVDLAVVDKLGIPKDYNLHPSKLTTITVHGASTEAPCKIVNGLTVSPLDEVTLIALPPTIIQQNIPS